MLLSITRLLVIAQPGRMNAYAGSRGFMSSMAELRAGLSTDQQVQKRAQQEQLVRDLNMQVGPFHFCSHSAPPFPKPNLQGMSYVADDKARLWRWRSAGAVAPDIEAQ